MTGRVRRAVTCALVVALATSVSAQNPARHVDRSQLMQDVTTLAAPEFEGRRTGTSGGLKARQWLLDRFAAAALTPAGDAGFLQESAGNIVGRVAGNVPTARMIVVTAHYDHLGIRNGRIYHGADDNASGVAGLLAAARHFATRRPNHTILFVAFDAEEGLGLRGSRAFVRSNLLPRDRVALTVNLDMLSRNDRNEIFAAGVAHYPWLKPILDDVQTRSAVTIRFGHDVPGGPRGSRDDWTNQSDHFSFHEAGIPFVYFGVEDHADYHQPTDTADKINPRFFGDVVDMVIEAIRTLDSRLE